MSRQSRQMTVFAGLLVLLLIAGRVVVEIVRWLFR